VHCTCPLSRVKQTSAQWVRGSPKITVAYQKHVFARTLAQALGKNQCYYSLRPHHYRVSRRIDAHGRDCRLPDGLEEVAGNCLKRVTVNWNDGCPARVL